MAIFYRFSIMAAAGVCGLMLAGGSASAQVDDRNSGIQYKRGQDVVPSYEGWQKNADGTYTFWFGYFNRNWEEEIDVPVGPDNNFDNGNVDRGQPTHFYTRRHIFLFKVNVPANWPLDKKLVWTLTTHGKTNKAKAWLQPEWEMNNGTITENRSSGTPDLTNELPTINGPGSQTVALPASLTLKVSATDDGKPAPKPRKPRGVEAPAEEKFDPIGTILSPDMLRGPGLNIYWILYRGPGPVVFEPAKTKPVFEKAVSLETKVTFKVPGNYVLRAIASDGSLEAFHDVAVTVK
jgi:hypothetical protein